MVIIEEKKTVIVTPPKCASVTLHTLGKAEVGFPNDQKTSAVIPAEYTDWRKLLVTRNPYARLVSLYAHRARDNAYRGSATPSFGEFSRRAVAGSATPWQDWLPIWMLVGRQNFDGLIVFENLIDSLKSYDLGTAIPHYNPGYHRPWREYYSDQLLEEVRPWAAGDCQAYGYELL